MQNPHLLELQTKLEMLEKRIDQLGHQRASPSGFIPFAEAAQLLGKSPKALTRWLQRDSDLLDGCHPRRIKGAIHYGDLLAMVEKKRLKPRGERARAALENLIR